MTIIGVIFGLIIGAIIVYLMLRPKMKVAHELDQEIVQKNEALNKEYVSLTAETAALTARRDEVNENLQQIIASHQQSANAVYEARMSEMQEKLSASADKLSEEYKKNEEEAKEEYLLLLEESVKEFNNSIRKKVEEIKTLDIKLTELKSITDAAVEANRRSQEMKEQKDFYRLILSDIDLLEIERLREVAPFLRDSEPLNKVIWKMYYEKPYTDLVGRVVGKNVKTGIYKITNLTNGMCYVGQAVNIAERWRQHIKRGLGAEVPTRNKLYPAMFSIGVENFSFEIIEECDRSKLNEREDYWQDYFQAKEFGYSIK
jgi:uncharacterized protein YoxC